MSESITDELREFAPHLDLGKVALAGWKEALLAIADRIDAEHERQLGVLYRDMSDAEWVRLPKDANDEYVHIGDVMAYEDNTKPMAVTALVPPAVFLTEEGPRYADMCRHYHAPTVEDVLREFALACEDAGNAGPEVERIAAEYADKLQLKEDE